MYNSFTYEKEQAESRRKLQVLANTNLQKSKGKYPRVPNRDNCRETRWACIEIQDASIRIRVEGKLQ